MLILSALPAVAAYLIYTGLDPGGSMDVPVVRTRVGLGLALLAAVIVAVFLTPLAWLRTGYSGAYTAGYAWLGASLVAIVAAVAMAIRLKRWRGLAAIVGLVFPVGLWAGVNLGIDFGNAASLVLAQERDVRCVLLSAAAGLESYRAAHGVYPESVGDIYPTRLTLPPRVEAGCTTDYARAWLPDRTGQPNRWLYRRDAATSHYVLGYWRRLPHLEWLGPRVCVYQRDSDRVACGFNRWDTFAPHEG
jgi:hypothetical protein